MRDPGVAVAVFATFFTIVTFAESIWRAWVERRLARRERAANLYDDYYSTDNYRRVVLPVIRVMLKWRGLPNEQRDDFRKALRNGWTGFRKRPGELMRAYVSEENLHDDMAKAHFRDTLSTEEFTEHEALTVFLYFWVKVEAMLDARLIDPKTVKSLFGRPYSYVQPFLKDLREDFQENISKDRTPAWSIATAKLDRFFQ